MLDLSENHEAVLKKKLQSSQKSQTKRELDVLDIGQRVLVQDPASSKWREAGTVVAVDPTFERSYEIKRDGRAKTIRHNHIHLRPMSSAKEGDETDSGAKKATGRAKSSCGGGGTSSPLPGSDPSTTLHYGFVSLGRGSVGGLALSMMFYWWKCLYINGTSSKR